MRSLLLLCGLALGCGGSASALAPEGGTHDRDSGEQDAAPAPEAGHARDAAGEAARDAAPEAARDDAKPEAAAPAVAFFDTATSSAAPVTRMLVGDPLDVVFSGLTPGASVTVSACLNGYGYWSSSAVFVASLAGVIDLAVAAPASGSYTGVDVDGLLWSMTPRATACAPAQPADTVSFTAAVSGVSVASGTLTWLLQNDDVKCISVSSGGLVGYYCAPAGVTNVGGIVTFGGSEGGLGTGQALAGYYASLGYPALGLAYFGAGSLPPTLKDIPLEYFQTAFQWLAKQPGVNPAKLLVNGGSRGGELALLLGATFPEVTGVIAELPSGLLWPCVSGKGAAWTYKGVALPRVPEVGHGEPYPVVEPDGTTAYADVPFFTSAIAASTPAQIAAATTQVQNTNGPILMIAGFDDQLWGACDLSGYAVDLLVSSGHADKYGDSLLCYAQAGHNVDTFALDSPLTTDMYAPDDGEVIALGGTPAGIAHAARDADDMKRAFLAANLR